ncbi:MAG TPA: hypothetical protein VJU82_06295 [Acidobacteriaceae bacterium]|nr:hypothetical protein [Acidobacteriaceae bacterium]
MLTPVSRWRALACGLLLGCLGSVPLPAQTQQAKSDYTFAGLVWGASPATTRSTLTAQGLKFIEVDADGDLDFTGTLYGYPAAVFAIMAHERLVRISVTLLTPDQEARAVYADLKTTLTRKYGTPRFDIQRFIDPYYDGDGFEEQAIRLDKANYVALWYHGTGHVATTESALVLSITDKLDIELDYDSTQWPVEEVRRNDKRAKIF